VNYNMANSQQLHPDLVLLMVMKCMKETTYSGYNRSITEYAWQVRTGWLPTVWAIELMGIDFSKIGYLNPLHKDGLVSVI